MAKGKRVGKIECLRFAFCVLILLYHISGDYSERHWMITSQINFFNKGFIGVEFFFLVTGYLTAAGIYKKRETDRPTLGEDTWHFMWRKIASLLPYHIILIVLTVLYRVISLSKSPMEILINSLPNLFFLQMSGYQGYALIGDEWYISSMLIALLVIYPLAVRFYDVYVRIVAPLAGFLLTGLLVALNGTLGRFGEITGFLCNGNIRAFAEISLGMFIFELVRVMREREYSRLARWAITIVEIGCYLTIVFYASSETYTRKYLGTVVLLFCVAVALSFSGLSYGQQFFDNKLCYFLGKCSLPIYLSQNLIRDICKHTISDMSSKAVLAITLGGTIVFGCLLMVGVEYMQKRKKLRTQ